MSNSDPQIGVNSDPQIGVGGDPQDVPLIDIYEEIHLKEEDSSCQVLIEDDWEKILRSDPTPLQTRTPPKKRKDHIPLKAIHAAQILSNLILQNTPKATGHTAAQLGKWAVIAEQIHRIDGHPWDDIEELIKWAQNDTFWGPNIQSMGKLREKWNQLQAKKIGGNNGQSAMERQFGGIKAFVQHEKS